MTGKQLKNAILQLAIQGKLVPQDAADEPASALLARIRKEKEQLVKAGKLKKKDLETTPICDEEKPFEIPESWEWCRLGEALDVRDGTHDSPKYFSEGFPLITSKNLKNGIIDFSTALLINENDYIKINDRSRVDDGDILYAMIGSIGNPAIVKKDRDFAIKNMALFKNVKNGVFMPYVFCFLELAQYSMREYASGGVQSFVSLRYLRNYIIPLPPLSEQHRIVSKIEELMPLVEEYGAAQEKLNRLNEALPEALKKSILQQAIQGKLVPQDANDEPASALLARIRKEKEQLVKAGKLKKKDLETTPIADDEKPFEIPESWEWVHFEDIAQGLTGKTPERGNQEYWSNAKYPWVSISDMTDYGYVKYTKEAVSEKATKIMRDISTKGSLLMSFKLTVGRTSILDIDAYHNEAIITVKPYIDNSNILRDFLFRLLPLVTEDGDTKDAIKGRTLNAQSIASLLIPLPPLAEQHRIVAKIEELMAMVDGMEGGEK